jgi:hypothetical protein
MSAFLNKRWLDNLFILTFVALILFVSRLESYGEDQLTLERVKQLCTDNVCIAGGTVSDEDAVSILKQTKLVRNEIRYFLSLDLDSSNPAEEIALLTTAVGYDRLGSGDGGNPQKPPTDAINLVNRLRSLHNAFVSAQDSLLAVGPDFLPSAGDLFWSVFFASPELSDFVDQEIMAKDQSRFREDFKASIFSIVDAEILRQRETSHLSKLKHIVDSPYLGADWRHLDITQTTKSKFKFGRVAQILASIYDRSGHALPSTFKTTMSAYLEEGLSEDLSQARAAQMLWYSCNVNEHEMLHLIPTITQAELIGRTSEEIHCLVIANLRKEFLQQLNVGDDLIQKYESLSIKYSKVDYVVALIRGHQLLAAMQVAKTIQVDKPSEAECHLWALLSNGRNEEFQVALRTYLLQFPGHLPLHLLNAFASLEMGKLEVAKEEFLYVLSSEPLDCTALSGLSKVLAAQSKFDSAQNIANVTKLIDQRSSSGLILAALKPSTQEGRNEFISELREIILSNNLSVDGAAFFNDLINCAERASVNEFRNLQKAVLNIPYQPWRERCYR